MTESIAYRETFTQLGELLNVTGAVGNYDAEILPTFGVETDPADDPEQARSEAEVALLQMVSTVKPTATFDLLLQGGDSTRAGDARKLTFECVATDPEMYEVFAGALTIKRVLFTAVGTHIHELEGGDRDMAVRLGRLSVREIKDAALAWEA